MTLVKTRSYGYADDEFDNLCAHMHGKDLRSPAVRAMTAGLNVLNDWNGWNVLNCLEAVAAAC